MRLFFFRNFETGTETLFVANSGRDPVCTGVEEHLSAGGGLVVARLLPQSIPVEYLIDAVTLPEHPDPDPRLVESNAKNSGIQATFTWLPGRSRDYIIVEHVCNALTWQKSCRENSFIYVKSFLFRL